MLIILALIAVWGWMVWLDHKENLAKIAAGIKDEEEQ